MAVLIQEKSPGTRRDAIAMVSVAGALAFPPAIFLLIPGDLALKAHLALHGLCAQRPSHSLSLGGNVLPLDARMTGIYLGALMTIGWLASARRLRGVARPPTSVLLLLAFGVAVMAGDGFVGLLADMGLPHPYEPSNAARLATGMGAGISLGAGLCHLFAMTVWARPERRRATIGSPWELLVPVAMLAATAPIVLSGMAVFFAPLALGLLGAAIVVVSMLAVCLLMLATNRAWTVQSLSQLTGPIVAAYLLAIVVIGTLSVMRLSAEAAGLLHNMT